VSRRGPRPVNERLRGLLVMLPWLAERQVVSTEEMAAHFDIPVDDLVADLTLASMCGISQDPRHLIDLYIDEGMVHFGITKYFERPLRLSQPEVASLVVAAKAASALPGADESGALSRAIRKIEAVLGADAVNTVDVQIDLPETIPPLRDAVADRAVVVLEYWTPDSGRTARRVVEPIEVFSDGPHWYLRGIDRDQKAERTFRVDRIAEWSRSGEQHSAPFTPRRDWFADAPELPDVTLVIAPGWRWVVEPYPVRSAEEQPDGSLRVRLVVTNRRWLERLLVRLGTHGRVETPLDRRAVGKDIAEVMLIRYRMT